MRTRPAFGNDLGGAKNCRAEEHTASEDELEFTCKRCVASSEYVRDEVCGMGVGQSPPMKDTALEATGSYQAAITDYADA